MCWGGGDFTNTTLGQISGWKISTNKGSFFLNWGARDKARVPNHVVLLTVRRRSDTTLPVRTTTRLLRAGRGTTATTTRRPWQPPIRGTTRTATCPRRGRSPRRGGPGTTHPIPTNPRPGGAAGGGAHPTATNPHHGDRSALIQTQIRLLPDAVERLAAKSLGKLRIRM